MYRKSFWVCYMYTNIYFQRLFPFHLPRSKSRFEFGNMRKVLELFLTGRWDIKNMNQNFVIHRHRLLPATWCIAPSGCLSAQLNLMLTTFLEGSHDVLTQIVALLCHRPPSATGSWLQFQNSWKFDPPTWPPYLMSGSILRTAAVALQ